MHELGKYVQLARLEARQWRDRPHHQGMLTCSYVHPIDAIRLVFRPARTKINLLSGARRVTMSSQAPGKCTCATQQRCNLCLRSHFAKTGSNGHAGASTSSAQTLSQTSAQTVAGAQPESTGRTTLSAVVTDAVKRWYMDTNKEAVKGDVVSKAVAGFVPAFAPKCSLTLLDVAAEATSIAGSNANRRLWLRREPGCSTNMGGQSQTSRVSDVRRVL